MSLPPGFVDELRGRVSLARIVGRRVTWDLRRSNAARGDYWAPCPFHQEKSASFHVEDAKGFYYCFGCQASGDAISFLRETENLGFMEAVTALAGEAGMALPEPSPAARVAEDRRSRLAGVMAAALGFFRLQLASARAAEARGYLDRRGLSAATRDRFEIGFAPESWTALAEALSGKGFAMAELVEAGLVRDDGRRQYDFFRNRIVFPIRDTRGRVVAFGGRALDPAQKGKYVNSPETVLFDKGRTLFNHGPARAAAGRTGELLVVEGYMDVIALVQAGFEATVAPMGTAITEDQLEALWRIAPEPLIALDGDAAGLGAAQRLIDLALPRLVAGRSLRFVLMPAGQDPDDVVRSGGGAAMATLIAASQPIVELIWRRETEGAVLDSPDRRAALDARLKAHLAKIRDESLRAHTWAALQDRRRALFAPQGRGRPAVHSQPRPGRPGRAGGHPARSWPPVPVAPTAAAKASVLGQAGAGLAVEARVREGAILLGLVNHPEIAGRFEDRLERMVFLCPDLGAVRDALLSCLAEDAWPAPAMESPAMESPAMESPAMESPGAATLAATATSLADQLADRLGRDPRSQLAALVDASTHHHIAAGSEPAAAARTIDEAMRRHSALVEREIEAREAEAALPGAADESVTWRLRQAAEARHRVDREALSDEDAAAPVATESLTSRLLEQKAWRRPRKR